MKKPKFLLTLAPFCLALMAISSSANPLSNGFTPNNATLPALNKGLVQEVQFPCREKRKDMTAEERRFCRGYYHHYGYPVYEYGYPAYGYGYPAYVYPAYGYGYPVYEYGYPPYGYGYPVYPRHFW